MKRFQETRIENAFQVEAIIAVYRDIRLWEHPPADAAARESGVVYEFWQLFFLESGHYSCRIEGCEPCLMEAGQLLICEPRKTRLSLEYGNAVAGIVDIRCASPRLKQMKNRIFSLAEPELAAIRQILQTGADLFHPLPKDAPLAGQQPMNGTPDWQLQVLKNRIELLLIRLYEQFHRTEPPCLSTRLESSYEAKFSLVREYLRANLGRHLTVADICRETGYSVSTLKRVFESQADCGVVHYFLSMKIQEAKRLLGGTDMTVTEISESLGFSGVHYFSRIFKRFTGCSPNGFR